MDASKLLALARIAREAGPNRYVFTARGDGLEALGELPLDAWLYWQPAGAREILAPALKGLDPAGRTQRIHVTRISRSSGRGSVELWEQPGLPLEPADCVAGSWLCVPRSALGQPEDGAYRFELLGLAVSCAGRTWGTVLDFFETGAHGILEIEAVDGERILVPFVRAYVDLDRAAGVIRARDLDLFREDGAR